MPELTCSECGSEDVIADDNENYCNECGLVLEEKVNIDQGEEWRAFTPDENDRKKRTGPPRNRQHLDRGVVTLFNPDEYDGTEEFKMRRMKRLNKRAKHNEFSRTRHVAYDKMRTCGGILEVPDEFVNQVIALYDQVADKHTFRGRSIEASVAGLYYIVLRINEVPRTYEEIAEACNTDTRGVKQSVDYIRRKMDLSIPIQSTEQYVGRFGTKLDLDTDTRLRATRITKELDESFKNGRNPCGIVAGALYFVTDDISQKRIADVCGVDPVTLRTVLYQIQEEGLTGEDPKS